MDIFKYKFFKYGAIFNFVMKTLHLHHPEVIVRELKPKKGELIIDIGGGTGVLSAALAREGAEVIVLDANPAMLEEVPPVKGIKIILGDVHDIPFPPDHFDAALCTDALHHFKDLHKAVREIARVLKPGGRFLIQEFDPAKGKGKIINVFEKWIGGRLIKPEKLQEMLKNEGLECKIKYISKFEYIAKGKKYK